MCCLLPLLFLAVYCRFQDNFVVSNNIWVPKLLVCILLHANANVLEICNTDRILLLTPWSGVLLEKLTGFAASQEIPRIFGTRRFLTVLTSAHQSSYHTLNQCFLFCLAHEAQKTTERTEEALTVHSKSNIKLRKRVVKFRSWPLYSWVLFPLSINRRLDGPQGRFVPFGVEINLLFMPGIEPRFLEFPAPGIATVVNKLNVDTSSSFLWHNGRTTFYEVTSITLEWCLVRSSYSPLK